MSPETSPPDAIALAERWLEHSRQHLPPDADIENSDAWDELYELLRAEPEAAWRVILALVKLAPDDSGLADVAAGPLEDLLVYHSQQFMARVETEATADPKFRRCLSGVWGWSSIPADAQTRIRKACQGEDPL